MNRNYYCKVNSQKEADKLLDKLKNIGEPIDKYFYSSSWYYILFDKNNTWALSSKNSDTFEDKIEVPASELIDYVTGKKVDTNSKVETKFEVGKWYELKYLFNGKPCNTLAKSTSDSINELKFKKYYDLDDKKWRTAVGFTIDHEIKIIYIKELSLQEIQQYLPEGHPDKIKEEFVLPEKWCVKADSSKTVQKWFLNRGEDFISDYVSHCSYDIYYFHFPLHKLNYYADETKHEDYTEITFDQFKKYVLKEDVKEKTNLKVEDLVEGEVYYWEHLPYKYISKCLGNFKSGASIYLPGDKFTNEDYNIDKKCMFSDTCSWNIRNVTPLEKKWLKTCIKQDKFIPKEELDEYGEDGSLMESVKIPVENNVKQNPLIFEECGKFPYVIDKYFIGVDPIMTQSWGIYTQMTTISKTKTTLSIDDEELPMVKPSKEIKVTNKLTID